MSEAKYGEPWVYVYVEVGDFHGPTCAIQDPELTYHQDEPKEWSYRQLVDADDNDIVIDQRDQLTAHGMRAVLCVNACSGLTDEQVNEMRRLYDERRK